ncbi:transcriptional regulator [Streptomyces sp. ME02-6979-3A]|uniref:winged helix-turn-helix domain-containing protein n=1 Tax=unclassified Streptomyces TaxID=2593676 RepID=UPI0029BF9958|nr:MULTISPECIES: transcriptional regulator [unclassified Streptomyces]MDX3326011.1 transcriptional regulator [Streptomyces sp. ME02-6979-3A]MDX3688210.1 transcriptional regulator [Streptomyces sp. AK04-4c]
MSVEDSTATQDDQEELHPTQALDDTVHQRVRLGVLTVAREADRVEFSFLKKQLAVTDGNLSRHLKVLEESGMITVEKGYVGRRPRTWVTLTREGAQALDVELRALRALVLRLEARRAVPGTPDT